MTGATVNPEVARALELAKKKYGPNLEGAMPRLKLNRKGLPEGHSVRPQHAFLSGKKCRKQGLMRVSPYYNAEKSDHFWFAGYDGKTIQEAIESQ